MAPTCATAVSTAQDYSQDFINRRSNLSALGVNLFGDETSINTGTTEFAATDIDLVGNNALPVRLTRRHRIQKWTVTPGLKVMGSFADWDLDVPYLHGTFAATSGSSSSGWKVSTSGSPNQRCSIDPNNPTLASPPNAPGSGPVPFTFTSPMFWYGNELHIPGQANQPMMVIAPANANRPSGMTSRWVTPNNWVFGCLTATANGVPGESFLAMAPDGTKYWFNWFAKTGVEQISVYISQSNSTSTLAREEVYIFPTRVEDRFGNFVTYIYDPANPMRLSSIQSSDGRSIQLTYDAGGRVGTATAGTQTWTYTYSAAPAPYGGTTLTRVTLPDLSHWDFNFATTLTKPGISGWVNCADIASVGTGTALKTITHPSGAIGTFTFKPTRLGRSYVVQECVFSKPMHSKYVDVSALSTKQIAGPGLPASQTWTFVFGPVNASWTSECASGCASTRVVTVTEPDGSAKKHTFSNRINADEGKLLSLEVLSPTAQILRSDTLVYEANPAGQPYPALLGNNPCLYCDQAGEQPRPRRSLEISQQGLTFSRVVSSFDSFAREASSTASNTLGFTRAESFTYHDNFALWVLGQAASVTVGGVVQSQTDYHSATALPWREYSFGKLTSTTTYNANGTPATVANGASETTTVSNWKRGLPQLIQFPDATSQSAVVDDDGWIRSVTDERSNTTNYSYDVMGRISGVTHPGGDTVAWLGSTITYQQLTASELGVPAGSWRREETLGTYRERTYYDGRLRPVLMERMDTTLAQAIYQRKAFDFNNQEIFTSYPSATSGATAGINSTFDALGRLTKRQTTDAPPIIIEQVTYLTGSKKQVTDADGKVTTLSFQTFDAPDFSRPTRIESHAQISITDIGRDLFGNITSVTQSGSYGGGTLGFTRSFTFDTHKRPCRRVDPESGSTVWGYDSASRVAWEAKGQTGSGCLTSAPAGATLFAYDLRGRPTFTNHPGTANDVTRGYDVAGNLTSVTNTATAWTYTYNKLNLLEREQAQIDGKTLLFNPAYNAMGHVASLTTPARSTSYNPDAFGRIRQLGNSITGIQFHPNGLPSAYSIANGMNYVQTLNNRLWPLVQETKLGAAFLQRYAYSYSNAGNLTFLDDQIDGSDDATLGYDHLHRLTSATGLWGIYGYTYDPLNNIRSRTGPNALAYGYNGSNLLTSISGAQTRSYVYNAKGEIAGDGSKTFSLNANGQITSITGIAGYVYDGNGKRIRSTVQGGTAEYSLYGLGGDLLYTEKGSTQTDYLKLAGQTLVELRKTGSVTTPVYLHPDLLGSPRKATTASAAILWQEHYDPYGAKLNGVPEKIGYTGHAIDPESGYTYMQARFYDPLVGRFLSTDPISFQDRDPFTFNRYAYANNSPYKFMDPDGQETIVIVNDNGYFTGTHTGLFIRDGENLLYDPAGSYRNDVRGTGGVLSGNEADLNDYVNFQKEDGPDVSVFTFQTTAEEEAQIKANIDKIGDPRAFFCATSVSGALKGIGPFKDLGILWTPKGVEAAMAEIKANETKDNRTEKLPPPPPPPPPERKPENR